MTVLGLSRPLTLTWLEDDEVVGVSAPLDVWVGQIVLALPEESRTRVMDEVVAEVERLNEEQLALEAEDTMLVDDVEEEDESPA